MGDGIKLPEDQRPSYKSIKERLRSKVSASISRLFVEDIQNDCDCSIEKYDAGQKVLYLSNFGVVKYASDVIELPMLFDINDSDLCSLLEKASEHAQESWSDLFPYHMLYGSNTSIGKLMEVSDSFRVDVGRWTLMPFVPRDYVFFLPEPDFFGAISVNVDKFGAFCMTGHMLKVYLGSEVVIRSNGLIKSN